MTIHAHTDQGTSYPAYINISERVSNPGDVIVTVRSAGESDASSIILGREQLRNLINDAGKHLDGKQPAPCAGHPGYSSMQPHQQRVVDERAELDGKLAKLNTFLDSVTFSTLDTDEQNRLKQQTAVMAMYSDILSERIAAFASADDYVEAVATGAKTITFDQFVQYGRDNGGNIVNGMPWSFSFHGHPVTHENDCCYLIMGKPGQDLRFTPDDVLVINPDGSLATIKTEPILL